MSLTTNAATGAATPQRDEYTELASLLRTSLREIGKGAGSRLATWADELRKCAAVECCGDAARLGRVVRWYCANMSDRTLKLPPAWSAGGFRKMVHQIEARMEREQSANPTAVISPEAAKAAERASAVGFPPLFRALAPTHAQICIDRYTPIRDRLAAWVVERQAFMATQTRHNGGDIATVAAAKLLLANFGDPATFARLHLEWASRRLSQWTAYEGDYSMFLFDPTGDHFRAQALRHLGNYAGPNAMCYWNALREVMGL